MTSSAAIPWQNTPSFNAMHSSIACRLAPKRQGAQARDDAWVPLDSAKASYSIHSALNFLEHKAAIAAIYHTNALSNRSTASRLLVHKTLHRYPSLQRHNSIRHLSRSDQTTECHLKQCRNHQRQIRPQLRLSLGSLQAIKRAPRRRSRPKPRAPFRRYCLSVFLLLLSASCSTVCARRACSILDYLLVVR